MPNKSVLKVEMDGLDELFKRNKLELLEPKNAAVQIPISEIDNFPNHPFKVKNDEAMQELVQSIKEHGLIMPAIVRRKEDGRYELISGHRRKMACEIAGLEKMSVIIRELDKDAAIITMVDSNMQRESILPSEKGFAYKMRLEAMKRQAGRPEKNNSSPMGINFQGKQSLDILSEKVGDSRNQIHRYIRLTELIPELIEMVDEKTLGFQSAVELSYISEQQQFDLLETIESEDRTPSLSQAQRMKQLSADGRLSMDVIFAIMTEEKPNEKEKITLKDDRFNRYFPKEYTTKQKEDLLARLLENWYTEQHRQEPDYSR
jgi:ParB family chromosome partitioning protein